MNQENDKKQTNKKVLTLHGWQSKAEHDYWYERDCATPTVMSGLIFVGIPIACLIILICNT